MKSSIERLWNLSAWSDVAQLALAIATGVSMLAAAHYLHGVGVPLSMARLILLGVWAMEFFLANAAKKRAEWHRWFAWHTVEIEDEHFVWLQYVERRGTSEDMGHSTSWYYRRIA